MTNGWISLEQNKKYIYASGVKFPNGTIHSGEFTTQTRIDPLTGKEVSLHARDEWRARAII